MTWSGTSLGECRKAARGLKTKGLQHIAVGPAGRTYCHAWTAIKNLLLEQIGIWTRKWSVLMVHRTREGPGESPSLETSK